MMPMSRYPSSNIKLKTDTATSQKQHGHGATPGQLDAPVFVGFEALAEHLIRPVDERHRPPRAPRRSGQHLILGLHFITGHYAEAFPDRKRQKIHWFFLSSSVQDIHVIHCFFYLCNFKHLGAKPRKFCPRTRKNPSFEAWALSRGGAAGNRPPVRLVTDYSSTSIVYLRLLQSYPEKETNKVAGQFARKVSPGGSRGFQVKQDKYDTVAPILRQDERRLG